MPNLCNQPYATALPRLGKQQGEQRGEDRSKTHSLSCMCVYVLEGADEALGTLVSPLLRHISPLRPGVEA